MVPGIVWSHERASLDVSLDVLSAGKWVSEGTTSSDCSGPWDSPEARVSCEAVLPRVLRPHGRTSTVEFGIFLEILPQAIVFRTFIRWRPKTSSAADFSTVNFQVCGAYAKDGQQCSCFVSNLPIPIASIELADEESEYGRQNCHQEYLQEGQPPPLLVSEPIRFHEESMNQ